MVIAYRLARDQVQRFQNELDPMTWQEAETLESESEDLLQLGIDAYQWIVRAERRLRENARGGNVNHPADAIAAIADLYKLWLIPGALIEARIAQQSATGAENAAEFRDVCLAVREKLNAMAWVGKSRKLRDKPAHEASKN